MTGGAGYSGTPLAKKLGLKDGQAVGFIALPDHLAHLAEARAFASVIRIAHWEAMPSGPLDYLHLFSAHAATVNAATPVLRKAIRPDGMIWISWPKKASKVPTDVTEDVIRARALADVLVDVKVCAVDDVWSGLKLVVRREHRTTHRNA